MFPTEELIKHYRLMLVIRCFEETVDRLFGEGLIAGTAHLCAGQEACAVGAIAALQADDLVSSNHRGHGHFIAKGGDAGRIMAELFGKAAGYAGGRGGSQHMADFSIGFLGMHGITGGMIPVATGAALSQKLLNTGQIVLCFFGDGATGTGAFHEAVNIGATWELPIVYFCENNQYAMSTPLDQAFKNADIADRARAYGLLTVAVDGNDYFAVRQATQQVAQRARDGGGPAFIEAKTYRIFGHSKSDDCAYRSADEEANWAARDPLTLMRERLIADGVISEAEADELHNQAQATVAEATEFARDSPQPDPQTAIHQYNWLH